MFSLRVRAYTGARQMPCSVETEGMFREVRFKGLKGLCEAREQQRMLPLGYLIMFCLHSAYFRPRTLPESKVGNQIPLTKWRHEPHSVSANLNYQLQKNGRSETMSLYYTA